MPIDTSMYNQPTPQSNPMAEAEKVMMLKKLMAAKQAQTMSVPYGAGPAASLPALGAGQPFPTPQY